MKQNKKKKVVLLEMIAFLLLVTTLTFISTPSTSIYALPYEDVFDATFESKMSDLVTCFENGSEIMSFINGTDIVYTNGFGDIPELDTVHQMGTMMEPITAVAVLQLYEEGLIDIYQKVNTYLPFDIKNPDYPENPIYVNHLLAHTSTLYTSDAYWDCVFNEIFSFQDMWYEFLIHMRVTKSISIAYDVNVNRETMNRAEIFATIG